MPSINLTDRAREHVQKSISHRENEQLIGSIVWATVTSGPTIYFFGLWRDKKVTKREGWWLFFYDPNQLTKEWIMDVCGLPLSIPPDTRDRLDGKTLDFVGSNLQEIVDASASSKTFIPAS